MLQCDRILTEESDHAQWLAEQAGFDTALILDQDVVASSLGNIHILPMVSEELASLQILDSADAGQRCADYGLYRARQTLPGYQFYWLLGRHVYINTANPAQFFAPMQARTELDFIAPEFTAASSQWNGHGHDSIARFVPAVYRCDFSLVRCSAGCVDILLSERQRLTQVFRAADGPQTDSPSPALWPSAAAFCPSMAVMHGLVADDLNVLRNGCYSIDSLTRPKSLRRLRKLVPDDMIYHPALTGRQFLDTSRQLLTSLLAQPSPVLRVADIVDDPAFITDLHIECGFEDAAALLDEIKSALDKAESTEIEPVVPRDVYAAFDPMNRAQAGSPTPEPSAPVAAVATAPLSYEEFGAAEIRFGAAMKVRRIRPAQSHPFKGPAFFHGHEPDSMRPMLSMDLFQVACRTIQGVCVGAESSIVRDGVVMLGEECGLAASWTHVRALERPPAAWSRPTQHHAQAVLITGPGHYIFGHWLVDFLPRLFVLYRAGYDIHALKYLLPADTPEFVFALLALAGIPRSAALLYDRQTDVVSVDELIVPNNLRTHSRMHPDIRVAGAFLTGLFLGTTHVPTSAVERIFVLRRGKAAVERRLLNRSEIEDIAAGAGYTLVDPAELPLPQQIALFAGARAIVGEYGSALHLALFSPPGTVIGCLRGNAPHPGWVQSGLAQELQHEIGYVIGAMEPNGGSFAVLPEQFRAALTDMQNLVARQ